MPGQVEPAAIAVSGLVKTYGTVRALDGVSFTLPRGSITALLGPNGAGKSTLLQILTGLFFADAGTVTIDGTSLAADPVGALARIGVVFQQPSLDLDLTVAQNLSYYAGLHGLTGRQAREAAEAGLALFDQTDLGSRKVRTLSGGMRRKIELGRALMGNPSILLLDEATQGLDPASRRDLVDHVATLARERGLAVLWATHIVAEVEAADAVIVLDKGRILATGTPVEVMAQAGCATLEDAFLALTHADREPPGAGRRGAAA
ncbi:ATP-binding cassette domain-containing protein [Alsobacter sp. R-9]